MTYAQLYFDSGKNPAVRESVMKHVIAFQDDYGELRIKFDDASVYDEHWTSNVITGEPKFIVKLSSSV